MQEAMLACNDVMKPTFTPYVARLATHKFPMSWFCKMANLVLGKDGELLEYRHLATWTHLYGNELGRLTQGMPGRNKGTNTIIFIPCHKVPNDRAKDVTYGMITYLIRPQKINEPNRTRLVCVCVFWASGSRGSLVITRYRSLPLTPGKVLPVCVTQ
jgi:hypothetical protein